MKYRRKIKRSKDKVVISRSEKKNTSSSVKSLLKAKRHDKVCLSKHPSCPSRNLSSKNSIQINENLVGSSPEELFVDVSVIATQELQTSLEQVQKNGNQILTLSCVETASTNQNELLTEFFTISDQASFLLQMEITLLRCMMRLLNEYTQNGVVIFECALEHIENEDSKYKRKEDTLLTEELLSIDNKTALSSAIDSHSMESSKKENAHIKPVDDRKNTVNYKSNAKNKYKSIDNSHEEEENDANIDKLVSMIKEQKEIYEHVRSIVNAACLLGHRSCQVLWGPSGNGEEHILTWVTREICNTNVDLFVNTLVLSLNGSLLNGEAEAIRVIADQMLSFLKSEHSAPLREKNEDIRNGTFDFGQIFHFSEQLLQSTCACNTSNLTKGTVENVLGANSNNNKANVEDPNNNNEITMNYHERMYELENESSSISEGEDEQLMITNTDSALSDRVASALPALQRALLLFKSCGVNLIVCITNIDRFAIWCDQLLYLLSSLTHELPIATTTTSSSTTTTTIPSFTVHNNENKLYEPPCETFGEQAWEKNTREQTSKCHNSSLYNREYNNNNKINNDDNDNTSYTISNNIIQSCNGGMVFLLTSSAPDIRHLEKRLSSRLTCETCFVPLIPWTPISLCIRFVEEMQHFVEVRLSRIDAEEISTNCNSNSYACSTVENSDLPTQKLTSLINISNSNTSSSGPVESRNKSRKKKKEKYNNLKYNNKENVSNYNNNNRENIKWNTSNKVKEMVSTSEGISNGAKDVTRSEHRNSINENVEPMTYSKMIYTRIVCEMILVMCNSFVKELQFNSSINTNKKNKNNNKDCYNNSHELTLAMQLHELTSQLEFSGAVGETISTALFAALRRAVCGKVNIFSQSSRRAHLLWWQAHLVQIYYRVTHTMSSTLLTKNELEVTCQNTLTEHIYSTLAALSEEFGVNAKSNCNTSSELLRSQWAELTRELSSKPSHSCLSPSFLQRERSEEEQEQQQQQERQQQQQYKSRDVYCETKTYRKEIQSHHEPLTSHNSYERSIEHLQEELPPPDMFDLIERGQLLKKRYISREMFLLYVQLYIHEESHQSVLPLTRTTSGSKVRLTTSSPSSFSSTSSGRAVKDLIEDVASVMGTRAAAAVDVEAYYTAIEFLQQYQLITIVEGSQLVSLTHSLTCVREFIFNVLQEQQRFCDEILGLEAKEYLRLRSMIESR